MHRVSTSVCGLLLAGAIGATPALAGNQLNVGMANTPNSYPTFLVAGSDRANYYDGFTDDLLTAELGKTGLTLPAPVVSDAQDVAQLRRLAIYTAYRAPVDIFPAGGYGTLYGPNVTNGGVVTASEGKTPGWEYIAAVDNGTGRQNVTVMVQVPDSFDPANACIVTATSSGSRGIYGAISAVDEWGLKQGCAVAYTDKGTGNGLDDLQANLVNRGERAADPGKSGGRGSHFHEQVDASYP